MSRRWRIDAEALSYACRKAGYWHRYRGEWRPNIARLSRDFGHNEAVLWNVLNGCTRAPSVDVLCDLATTLGCDVLDLVKEVPHGDLY